MDKDVQELLSRGVGEFIDPDGAFRKKLETHPEEVIIKFGIDPTRPDIHLGHAFIFRKLKEFQDLGAKVVFLLGDFTAQIGDPSGKSTARPEIPMKEIHANAMTFLQQNKALLNVEDTSKYAVLLNTLWFRGIGDSLTSSDFDRKLEHWKGEIDTWIGKIPHIRRDTYLTISLMDFLRTLRKITQAQLIERDMFQKRIKSGGELYMHEMMYPVLQGLDSYAIAWYFGSCDLEVGGTDQTFNMLMGRTVMKMHNGNPQAVLSFKLLEGVDGREKMSKSLDNYIAVTDEPNQMYGKVMSIPDSSLKNYFELCTQVPMIEVEEILNGHLKNAKMRLAREIVTLYHGADMAQKAEHDFETKFSRGEVPEGVPVVKLGNKNTPLVDILINQKIVSSKSEFNRLEKEGAIIVLETKRRITGPKAVVDENATIRIGKHRFLKLEVE